MSATSFNWQFPHKCVHLSINCSLQLRVDEQQEICCQCSKKSWLLLVGPIYDERVPWIHRSPTITATIPLSCTTSHTTLHRASNPHHIQTSIRSNHTLITLVLIFKLTRFLSNVRPKLLCKKQDIVKCRNRFNTLPPPYSLPTALIPMPIYHCSPTRTRFHPTPPWVGICPRPTDTRCR